jgi:AraC family transcriptional regulator
MATRSHEAVARAIEKMQSDLGDQLTIDDLARAAMFSKFHFCRLFQQVTGLPPGRFLAALRLVEAKRLLVSTSLSVTEISNQVGYSSVGTFSYRFKSMVGESPSFYRQLGDRSRRKASQEVTVAEETAVGVDEPVGDEAVVAKATARSTVHGQIHVPFGTRVSHVFVGMFEEPLPQGQPVACAVLDRPGAYVLENVPKGHWYLMACARVEEPGQSRAGRQGPNLLVAPSQAVWMESSIGHRQEMDLTMRPKRPIDTPALLAFPDIAAVTYFVERAS